MSSPASSPDATSATKRKAPVFPVPDEQKKRRLDASPAPSAPRAGRPATLPPELWQHVFSFCSLADLGRLTQVNRSFLTLLADVRDASTSKSGPGRLSLLKSESLWASARNALPTKPPKPLPGFTERHMCQLAWSQRCQFCNKLNEFSPGERIWQKGPGNAGVRPIWPFAITACGPCLLERCQTVRCKASAWIFADRARTRAYSSLPLPHCGQPSHSCSLPTTTTTSQHIRCSRQLRP